eukprot:CAMPEP_0194117630 /NCGR_PEP_ID=MMETSP0150-20130528/32151_1 /TAXON_ID=122233 /ORGANISM="Chaetoceros debilis, Strain MM31A-1" /LENGTH=211 /DNA_ID=CAMNT_0038808739 /DNA_START=112 /DNA_END=747 /DNA_ORIENTATION=+
MSLFRRIPSNLTPSVSRKKMARCMSGFSFAGPKKLDEIIKTELLEDKTKSEIADIWMAYHEEKDRVHGTIVSGEEGKLILERAGKMKFFIEPIFRDDGFFMLLSQFQTPSHFLLAYLEDFKMDPNRAQPLMTFSVFNDLAESHKVSLVRCDVINKGIEESEGVRVMQNVLDAYRLDEDFTRVEEFNEKPTTFDVDDFISSMNQKWKDDGSQ